MSTTTAKTHNDLRISGAGKPTGETIVTTTTEPTDKTERKPASVASALLSAFPTVTPRRPYIDAEPDGYLESDRDYLENNSEACSWLLDRADEIRQALECLADADAVLMPRELTAENGAKAALIGEFAEIVEVSNPDYDPDDPDDIADASECESMRVPVSWANIKKIHRAAVAAVGR